MVTADVWGRPDRRAGTATAGEVRRFRAAAVALLAAVLLVVAAAASGAAVPRLRYDDGDPGVAVFGDGVTSRAVVRMEHTIGNDGWFPVTISGAGLRADGLRLARVQESRGRAFPLTLGPGDRIRLSLVATVLDCERAAAAPAESLLRAERWWGSQSVRPAGDGPGSWARGVELACVR